MNANEEEFEPGSALDIAQRSIRRLTALIDIKNHAKRIITAQKVKKLDAFIFFEKVEAYEREFEKEVNSK